MPPDEDGEGRGHGLAMLRLEARRYKREMQQILMQRQLYEQKNSTSSLSSEDSSRVRDDRWRLSDAFTTSPATSGTPMFWNREDVPVSRLEQLAIVEEGTQTDCPSKSEVQTETEKLQYDDDVISSMRESGTVSSAVNDVSMLKTCSRHCDELRSRISQEASCECLAEAAVRVNADVLFTAKPKRVTVEGQVEVPGDIYSRAFRSAEVGIGEQTSTMATSPIGSLNKDNKSTDPGQGLRTGLRSLVFPVPRQDSACSPIPKLYDCEARYKRLGDTSKGTERFSCSQEKSAPETSTIAPLSFSTQVSTPQPEALCGVTKAGDNTPDSSTEIRGSKRIRNESTGEGAMAARLATKIKHALEAIGGKADTRSGSSIFNLPGRAIQSTSACRLHYKDQYPEIKLFENVGESFEGRPVNGKEIASSDSSLPETCHHARTVCVSYRQHHTNSTPCSDADISFQNVMDTDRSASNKLSGNCILGEVSAARAAQRAERRPEASKRANVKSCGDYHASHQAVGIEKSMKTDVRQSGMKHSMEKQRLLSNVQKLQNVAETAKRLYTDLVDCAYDELRSSTDCGILVKHQDGDGARDISKFARSEFCPSTEIISAHRADVTSTDKNEVCGRCFVCRPQLCNEQPTEEAQTDSLDEITIELSDASPTNILVSRNDCTERSGYNVEVSTPCELPCQRVSSPNNRRGNIVRRQSASWKDACKPAIRRTRPAGPGSNQQVKKGFNKCLLDPHCDGPRNCCHMPTRGKCSRARTVCISSPKRSSTMCLLDPRCDGPRNSCHMPTRAKYSGATAVCISPPKKSNKCPSDSYCDGPRNSCHMPTREESSGATTVCISPPKKDSNMCCLDPRCVASRDSCHMPTYSKSSRASCGPGGSSRIKRNNGTNLGNKNPSGHSRCLAHRSRRMEPMKGNLERNPCRGRFERAHPNNLDDENHGHIFSHERKHSSPARRCRDISKPPKVFLDEISKVGTLKEARDQRNLCMMHNDLSSSSMKGKEIKVGTGSHEETAGLHHSSSERMDLNNPVKNVHRSFQECSRIGVVKNHSTLTAIEDIEKDNASVGKETRQPTAKHMTGNASALAEAHTQTTQLQNPQSDNVNRAVAATGLVNEIEVIIADQPGKSNRRIKQSNYLTSQRKLSEGQKDSFGQTKLDVAVIAAANAVKKLKPVSLLPLVKQDEGNQKATPRKGPTPRVKLMAEDTIGSSFYDQMYKELEELSSERMQLVRQERAKFPSESLFFPHQDDRHAAFSIKRRSSSELKNLTNAGSELGESTRSMRMQRSEESPRFWHEPIGSHTPGSKRQRSATSPAREHGNKLLRLSVGKAESQAGRKKQDQHSTLSVSLNQAVLKSNKGIDRVRSATFEPLRSGFLRKKGRSVSELDVEKLNDASSTHLGLPSASMSKSSAGMWKPVPKEAQAKTTTKRKVLTTRKVRPPAWVERMSKAKNVFSSLIRPLLLAHIGKERQLEANTRREASQPPGLMFRSSVTSKQFGKRIPGDRGFSLVQRNPPRIHSKKCIAPNQYDIKTGRKIVHAEREPGELLRNRVENQHVRPSSESLHEKNVRMTRRPSVKHGIMPSAVTTLSGNHVSIRGWNADPLIRSDIPHKTADIIRDNRNGGLNVQIRRRDAGGRDKPSASTSVGQMNIRHVTFAGMVVHNSRNEKIRKGLIAPQSIDSLGPQVVTKKASTSQPSRAKRTFGKRRSSSAAKIPPMQGKLHRYGGGGGKWTYHEGFWTEMFKSELEEVSQDDSLQSLLTPGSIARLDTPGLELRTAQVLDTLHKPAERAGPEDFLTVDPSLVVQRTDDEDVTGSAGERNSGEKNDQSSATNFELMNDSDVQRSGAFTEENGKPQNSDLFKCLGFFGSNGFEDGAIIDHRSAVATKVLLSPSQVNEEDERAEFCSETKPKIVSVSQAQVSIVDLAHQQDNTERREPIPSSEEFPHSPLRLLDEVFPDSTENEALVSMFDRLQVATSVHAEAHSEKRHEAVECVTRQTFLDTSDHENEGLLKNLELERTLMDIALHTILHDDPLEPPGVSVSGVEPISLPINRRLPMQSDKEVEAIVHAHDMSQSPLSKAIPCVDRSTEQDIIPHVDRATELDTVPHVDRATELDNFSLYFKDQDSQTTDAEFGIGNIQRCTSLAQEKCGAKLQDTQVHHQATECRVPWNTVGIQMPDTAATISASSPSLPDSMPMMMPVFFQQLGTNMLPMVFPTVNFSTSSNLQSRPVSRVGVSFPAGVDQGTQATESQIQPNPRETAAQVHDQVSKLPISSRAVLGQLGAWEEENASDWEEESTRGSSPSTPSTPLSSPDHKLSLRKAMQLCPDKCSVQEFTVFARKDPQPLVSEVCQVSKNDCLQAHQTLVNELAPPIQVVTETVMEEITTGDPPLIASANETRRGTSWAKVKEMEEAALTLLRAALMKTPSATSSSECSQENSPEVFSWMSPGEVNIEEFRRSRDGRRFVNNSHTSQESLGKLNHSHAWSWLSCGRTSIGEVYNPICFLGPLSEGEIEAGVVPSFGELGQIQNEDILASHSITDQQGQGFEPGEIHMNPGDSSPQKSPTHQVVSEILTDNC